MGIINNINSTSFDASTVDVVVAPSAVHLDFCKNLADSSKCQISSQNIHNVAKGAFTGETSANMLTDMGISWTILGHSERRHAFGEAGKTMEVNIGQLKTIVENVGSNWSKVVIAYEPVWAIGTGVTATPDQAQEVHGNLRKWLNENVSAEVADSVRILYGGSVNAKNCKELAGKADVDGFLVGGASLKPEFSEIINANN